MTRKLVMIHFHFEYTDAIEAMLDRLGIADYIRYPMIEGKDRDGKHFGTQTFPGNVSVVHAQVEEDTIEPLLDALRRFREQKVAHRHVDALVLPIERRL